MTRIPRRGSLPVPRTFPVRMAVLPVVAALLAMAPGAASPQGHLVFDGDGACTFPAQQIKGTPWALQRVLLDQLWQSGRGKGVKVAVIDTGVDVRNPQLAHAVDTHDGFDFFDTHGDGTADTAGHGTEVAGIIAARPVPGTGFVGIAPQATILPIRQNDERSSGTPGTLALAVRRAANAHAGVINISQDTTGGANSDLEQAIDYALGKDVVVVAAAGNSGANGVRQLTYPAAYPGVLAVGASDRNDERAGFSQAGAFVGVAAPGVDMVTTVPGGGQCADSGTSFSAPYVAGVAALIRAKHPGWTRQQVVAQIEQTADRTDRGRNDFVGWGVVDPVRALTDDAKPVDHPVPDKGLGHVGVRAVPAAVTLGETPHQRAERTAVYALAAAVVLVAVIVGGAVAARDARRRRGGAPT